MSIVSVEESSTAARTLRLALGGALLVGAAIVVTACGHLNKLGTGSPNAPLRVVAAENFWGSIAAQIGGSSVQVSSVVTSPATDPHSFEPTAADARTVAAARMVIMDGVGYDPWVSKLIAADPLAGRIVLTVGDLVGVKPGGNPHRWYSPSDVQKVVAAIARDYTQLDPARATYFNQQRKRYETRGLAQYQQLITAIRRKYRGVRVGASESIFAPLAQALGLRLLTPPSFLRAVSEGAEPTASDKTTIGRQIAQRQIKVWVYDSQNATPDVTRITEAARARAIPVIAITETLAPLSASFQDWQARQLEALAAALAKATGR